MKLPNGEHAIVDIRKLQAYCLNSRHSVGRNKARVFASVGIREANAEELRTALLAAAGNTMRIRSTWIVRIGEDLPRLTSCYVL